MKKITSSVVTEWFDGNYKLSKEHSINNKKLIHMFTYSLFGNYQNMKLHFRT